MSGGFKILVGDDNQELSSVVLDLVSEIRVEQYLSKSTQYAIRFERDLCDEGDLGNASMIPAGSMVTIQVDSGTEGADVCLVRGPVTKIKSSQVLGGPGSWLEVHGLDRRAEMDKNDVTARWTGDAVDIVKSILSAYEIDVVDAGPTGRLTYNDDDNQLNQSGNDLKQIDQLARRLGYEFWFSYASRGSGFVEEAHFKPSPPNGNEANLDDLQLLSIAGSDEQVRLKANVADRQCSNITAFQLDVEVDRATEALIAGINENSGDADTASATPRVAEVTPDAEAYEDVGTASRILPQPGSSEQQRPEVEAVLDEEAWFVKADASTSVHLLKTIVRPHDIVAVDGLDTLHRGNYQVSEVVHVINDWGHLMDLKLRRNTLGAARHA